jgi:hypothetical protein
LAIVGYNIESITAERREVRVKRIDINSRPRIISVKETKVDFIKGADALAIGFEFLTTYSPDMGKIRIDGRVLYSGTGLKKIVQLWERKGQLPREVELEVKNFLFRKCLSLGVFLAEQLQMPPPLAFPVLAPRKEERKTSYIG